MGIRAKPYSSKVLKGSGTDRFRFSGENLREVLMPVGGIGVGSIGFTGTAGFENFSIFHEPDNTSLPDGHGSPSGMFAAIRVHGESPVCRVVEGPVLSNRIFNRALYGQGLRKGGHEGFPRFDRVTFTNRFPFATVDLSDTRVPLKASVTAFNPFIPGDDHNSSIPVMAVEYAFRNTAKTPVTFDFMFSSTNWVSRYEHVATSASAPLGRNGVVFSADDAPDHEQSAGAAFQILGKRGRVKASWFRGGWFDGMSMLWREFESGKFRANAGAKGIKRNSNAGGSVWISETLKPGETTVIPVLMAWYFPNGYMTQLTCCSDGACCAPASPDTPAWKAYYAAHWDNAADVIRYVETHYASLKSRTEAFCNALFSSDYPAYVIDAIVSNLAIIKSPTIIRLDHGGIWGWEGCFADRGCCAGSCTHVWNYAQAIPHLFPAIERSLREQELIHSMDEKTGRIGFRSAFPYGPTQSLDNHPASDGQLGGIMKVYRDWQITGDDAWLASIYPRVKKSMDFCIEYWDPKRLGVLVEPHHNTYDIEFWGPNGMTAGFYIGALSAMAEMTAYLCETGALGNGGCDCHCDHDAAGDDTCRCDEAGDCDCECHDGEIVYHCSQATVYADLAKKGAAYLDAHLFNGEYYYQKVQYKGLRDTSFSDFVKTVTKNSSEEDKLLKREGPKYQYGTGCLSDGVFGIMQADFYGIDTPVDPKKVRANLSAIFQYNFRPSLKEHSNPQRPGYALGNEPGLLLCSWPNGGKPSLPFVYSDEVWTGIEYQVAAHLIHSGFVDEGLTIVRAVRDRYRGDVRNPFNEYECGSYYARAMASYALIQALSGFWYSAVDGVLHLRPMLGKTDFKTFFSVGSGFGVIRVKTPSGNAPMRVTIRMIEGTLELGMIIVFFRKEYLVKQFDSNITLTAGKTRSVTLAPFDRDALPGE